MSQVDSLEAHDQVQWTPEFMTDFLDAAIAGRSSLKAWVAVWRALHLQKVQRVLLHRAGLGNGLGLVDDQCSGTVEMRTLAGQMVTVLAMTALDLGLIIEVGTHVLYSSSDLSKYLELNPQRHAQVTRLRVNVLKHASDLVCSMSVQGNHAKTLIVKFPSPTVAALLQEQPTREQVQRAVSAAPGTVLVVGSGSDNYGHLSGIERNRENLAVWLALPGTAAAAQQPLCSWAALLEDPPVPTATKGTCPTLAVARLTGLEHDTDLVREVDGVRLALERSNPTGYCGVVERHLVSGQTRFGWKIIRWSSSTETNRQVASCKAIFDTAVGAALDRAKEAAKIAP